MRLRARRCVGFSLLELLVAMSVLAMLLTAVYGTLRAAQRSVDVVDDRSEEDQLTRGLLEQIGRDFHNLYPLMMSLSEEELAQQPPTEEGAPAPASKRLAFLHENEDDTSADVDLDVLSFASASLDPVSTQALCSDLAEITYYIDTDDSTEEEGLVKTVNRLPGLAAEPIEPQVIEISKDVISLNFRFWEEEEGDWIDEWESEEELPPMIEITLGISRGEDRDPLVIQTVVEPRSTGLPELTGDRKAGGKGEAVPAEEEPEEQADQPEPQPSTPQLPGGTGGGLPGAPTGGGPSLPGGNR